MKRPYSLFIGVLLFSYSIVFAQKTIDKPAKDYFYNDAESIELFKNFTLDFDFTPKPSNPMGGKVDKDIPFYFSIIRNNKEIERVAVYNEKQVLTNYLLDRAFNLYFSYLKSEYFSIGKHISKTVFYNLEGKEIAYASYRWIQKKKGNYLLREVDLYGFHPTKKTFVRLENRFFIYNKGKALGKDVQLVAKRNSNLGKISNENYQSTLYVARYTRYNDGGKVQYRRKMEYNGDKLVKTNYYNKDDLLVKTIAP